MSTLDPDVELYLRQVREALADLPPGELDELTDELATHFSEIAAESDTPLAERLGPAAEYAAELRASAGLAPATRQSRGAQLHQRAAELSARLDRYPAWVQFREFLPQLRPGWWVLRGIAAAYVLLEVTNVDSLLVFVLLGGAFAWISVALGMRGRPASTGPRLVALAGNAFLAVAACVLLVTWVKGGDHYEQYSASYEQGPELTNLHLYDSQGRQLTGVQVFDQYGHPVDLPGSYDGPQWLNSQGDVANVYPRPPAGYGDWPPALTVPPITPRPEVDTTPPDGPADPSTPPSGSTAPSAPPSGSAAPSSPPSTPPPGSPSPNRTP